MSQFGDWSEILPRLVQGGWRSLAENPGVGDFDLIVNCSSIEYEPRPGQLYIRWRIEDGDPPDHWKLRGVAELVSFVHRSGQSVLVNCDAGLNRSGLVVAYALLDVGYSAEDAINLIRRQRDEYALCNQGFELAVRRAEW